MDTLYTGDIPKDYKYIYLLDGYIYLFNKKIINNETVDCYKINNSNGFIYMPDKIKFDNSIELVEVNVTKKHYYRTDYCNILLCSCLVAVIFIFITNIITSFFKKGGVLSGLF